MPAVRTGFAGQPLALKILWTIWTFVVSDQPDACGCWSSLGNGDPEYFWPMWMAVPGVALAGATAVVQAARSHR